MSQDVMSKSYETNSVTNGRPWRQLNTITSKDDRTTLRIMSEGHVGSGWGWSDELDAVSLPTRFNEAQKQLDIAPNIHTDAPN